MHCRRRPRWGDLVQADRSHHDWLEGRGSRTVPVVIIGDATSEVVARSNTGEATEAYMGFLGRYVRKHGGPVALYTDRDSIFRSEDRHPDESQPLPTQFGQALNSTCDKSGSSGCLPETECRRMDRKLLNILHRCWQPSFRYV